MSSRWRTLSNNEKAEFYRRYKAGENISELSNEIEAYPPTFERQLRAWAQAQRGDPTPQKPAAVVSPNEPAQVKERNLPTHEEMFQLLKLKSYSLDELCSKFDRSPATMRQVVEDMKSAGYVVEEQQGQVAFKGNEKPRMDFKMTSTLADEQGQVVTFAAASDLHAGSSHSQPTNRKKFLDIAYHEYGVRAVFDPGDTTTGVGGYRGQEHDLIPALRSYGRQTASVTEKEIWLADQYTPHYDGLTYYTLGGNHDYWHVVNSGIDAIAKLSRGRDDMVYLGYDVADVPLTDRVDIRLWHPSGGVPYSISYRLQKALEQTAFEELTKAITESTNPRLRILLAGHMHIEVKFNRGPMLAAQVGCFEGMTNYLKRKALYPQIGGSIFRVWLTDGGLIQRVEYTFIPFNEIENDWQNWPVPPTTSVLEDPDEIGVIFSGIERPSEFEEEGAL